MAWKYKTPKQRGIAVPNREFSTAEQRNMLKPMTAKQRLAASKRFAADGEFENAIEILNAHPKFSFPMIRMESQYEAAMRKFDG